MVAKRCAAQQPAGSRRTPDCVEAVRAQPRARSQVYAERVARRRRILNLTASMAVLISAVPPLMVKTEKNPAGAPIEVHIYARGGHAFNMGYRTPLATLKHWPDRMAEWLADNEWLKPREASKDAAQK